MGNDWLILMLSTNKEVRILDFGSQLLSRGSDRALYLPLEK